MAKRVACQDCIHLNYIGQRGRDIKPCPAIGQKPSLAVFCLSPRHFSLLPLFPCKGVAVGKRVLTGARDAGSLYPPSVLSTNGHLLAAMSLQRREEPPCPCIEGRHELQEQTVESMGLYAPQGTRFDGACDSIKGDGSLGSSCWPAPDAKLHPTSTLRMPALW